MASVVVRRPTDMEKSPSSPKPPLQWLDVFTQWHSSPATQMYTRTHYHTIIQLILTHTLILSLTFTLTHIHTLTQTPTYPHSLTYTQSLARSLNQSLTRSLNQSLIDSISQSLNQSVCQSVTQSVTHSLTNSISQSLVHLFNPPHTRTLPPVAQSGDRAVRQPLAKSEHAWRGVRRGGGGSMERKEIRRPQNSMEREEEIEECERRAEGKTRENH